MFSASYPILKTRLNDKEEVCKKKKKSFSWNIITIISRGDTLELQTLQFKVQTDELLKAKSAIDDLSKAVGNLNTTVEKEAKTLTTANKPIQDTTKATEFATESTNKNITALERQQKILEYMTQGFSRGQSSILATASAANAATEDLKKLGEVLQTQRRLIGGDTFDKSMSGLVALTNQYGEIREAIRQYNSDTDLTRNQTRELARDKERIIEKMKLEGASFSQIKTAIRDYNIAYVEAATKVNNLTKVEKDRERTMRDTANASRNVQAAEERLFATVTHLNEGLSQNSSVNERAALAIGSYERNLRLAGITGEQAALKMQKFIAAQKQVSDAEAKNRASYVSRGIGVQMGDVAVSLASGMNPLTVAIQQGEQIRGLLQQSGLEAAQMGKVMQQAVAGIATSFKDVGIAVGSFALGGIKSLGSGITELASKLTGIRALSKSYADDMLAIGPPTAQVASNISKLSIIATASGLAIGGLLTFILALTAGFYKAIKESDNLAASLAINNEKIKLSHESAMQLVDSLRSVGVTSAKSTEAIRAMAEAGGFTKDEFELVAKSAADMNKYLDVSISDTVKKFKELKKDPMEALIQLAGVIDSTTTSNILQLIEQGKTLEAQKAIVEAYANINKEKIEQVKQDYSGLTLAIKEWGSEISAFFDRTFKSLSAPSEDERIKQIEEILKYRKENPLLSLGASGLGVSNTSLEEELALLKKSTEARLNKNKADERSAELNKLKAEASTLGQKALSAEEVYLKKTTALQEKANKLRQAGDEKSAKIFEDAQTGVAEEYLKASKATLEYKANHDALNASKKSAKEINDYYIRTLEKIDNLNIKNTQTTLEQTKAEQLLAGLYNDPIWTKLPTRLQNKIKARIDNAKVIELENKALDEQRKRQEEMDKLKIKYKADADAQLLEIQSRNKNIGLTEEQRLVNEELLKVEKQRIANLEEIDKLVASQQNKLKPEELEDYKKTLIQQESSAAEERKRIVEQATRDSYAQATAFSTGWDNAFASYLDSARNTADLGKRLFEGMTEGMTDAIMKFVTTGKFGIKDFANTFLQEILRMQIKQASTQLIGASGIGGFISSILPFGSSTSASTGPSTAAGGGSWLGNTSGIKLNANANGNVFMSSGIVNKYANGGAFTNSIVSQPTPFMFANGARFGVMGEAGPEAILPLQRNSSGQLGVVSSGASTNVSVDIHNYTGANVKTEEVSDSRGGRKINVIIGELAAGEVNRPGSALNKSMRNGFGLSPALNGR